MSNISPATKSIADDVSIIWTDLDCNSKDLSDKMLESLKKFPVVCSQLKYGYSLEESLHKWQNLLRTLMSG